MGVGPPIYIIMRRQENCERNISSSHPKMDDDTKQKRLHIAMFPWLAFGHMIPFLNLAKHIARRGHKVSYLSTPRNIQRLPRIPPDLSPSIDLIALPLPLVENLPSNSQATSDLPFNKIPYLKIAFDGLKGPVEQFLSNSTPTPDWVIYDFAPHWLPPITSGLNIYGAFFSIFHAWSLTFGGPTYTSILNGDDPRTRPEDFVVPPDWVPFPSVVAYRLHEAKRIFDHFEVNNSGVSDMFRMGSVIAGCDIIASKGCFELEGQFITLLGGLHKKPSLPVGLLPPADPVIGNDEDDTWIGIKAWLDQQKNGSVVYIALGSELVLSQQEVNELALGLELSGLPFFWVLRKQPDPVIELPSGFEERVKERAMVWKSWAPQPRIMAHDSVGGFLTHCGLSSIIEAIYFGRPLIMLPFSMDQGLNARVFEAKKVGVEVPRNEDDGSYGRDSVAETVRLIVVDAEGQVYRDNAKEMSKLLADKNLNKRYLDNFVGFLKNYIIGKGED